MEFPGRAGIRLVVIQATSFCNINCKYCYLSNRSVSRVVSAETLVAIRRWLVESGRLGNALTVCWHAGEPLVLPAPFYEQAFSLLSSESLPVERLQHSLQTNATLVTEEHCEVLQRFGVNVGVSLDGPEAIHDANRVTRAGQGTFRKVVAGIQRLQAHAIPVSAIAVVTEGALQDPDAFYACFAELDIPIVGLNVQEIEGVNTFSYIREAPYLQRYKHFLRRLFYLSCTDGRVGFRELMHSLNTIHQGQLTQQSSEAEPFYIMSFNSSGGYSTFSPELLEQTSERYGSLQLGTVFEQSYQDCVASKRFLHVAQDVAEGVKRCAERCAYFGVCGGGAPANKLGEHGHFAATETFYCRFTKMAEHDVILDLFEAEPTLIEALPQTRWWGHDLRQP